MKVKTDYKVVSGEGQVFLGEDADILNRVTLGKYQIEYVSFDVGWWLTRGFRLCSNRRSHKELEK